MALGQVVRRRPFYLYFIENSSLRGSRTETRPADPLERRDAVLRDNLRLGDYCLRPRFSNPTHRGITAYVSKNTSWCLFATPSFIASGLAEGLARAGMLAIVSLVYLLRARAEERLLSRDPAYRDYAENVAAHGLLATTKRRLAPREAPRV
ncbi:hypothetical protein HFO97_09870 [Rhizobium leguminosarum]|nr:hypothetical protein [Rhizobium leguminosarum]